MFHCHVTTGGGIPLPCNRRDSMLTCSINMLLEGDSTNVTGRFLTCYLIKEATASPEGSLLQVVKLQLFFFTYHWRWRTWWTCWCCGWVRSVHVHFYSLQITRVNHSQVDVNFEISSDFFWDLLAFLRFLGISHRGKIFKDISEWFPLRSTIQQLWV